MLKKRVLSSSGEFHCGPKRATREARERSVSGGFSAFVVVAETQFEV